MEELESLFFETFLKRQDTASFGDSKVHTIDSFKALTVKDKLQIATALLGDLNHDRSETQEQNEISLNDISIEIEAVGMRLMDLEKDALMFKRDVLTINSGFDNQKLLSYTTAVVKSEKLLRHFQSKSLQLDSTKDKLKLQQADQRKKLQKIETKLKQRDEMGNSFHYIDFHQLQTSNKQCTEELKLKSKELERMKITFEKSEKELVDLNKQLKAREDENCRLEKSLELRRRHLERLEEKVQSHGDNIQTINVVKESHKFSVEKDGSSMMNRATGNANVDVMDIVNQQTKIYELQSAIKTWTKKVDIARLVKKNKSSKKL